MIRTAVICLSGACLVASSATAQHSEIGGANLDAAGSIAGTAALGSYLDDYSGSRSPRVSQRARAKRAAATCANLPRVRARLGADDPNVQGLARACRRAGF
jgi:hypothetical protein